MRVFACVQQHLAIISGEEISEATLEKHDSYMRGHEFPFKKAQAPLVYVADDHEKASVK